MPDSKGTTNNALFLKHRSQSSVEKPHLLESSQIAWPIAEGQIV